MPADFNWAYLAGLIDGEGCISVGQNQTGAYYLAVRITQKNYQDLLSLSRLYGGHLYPKRREEAHQLEWLGQEAGQILRKIFPYIKWKKDEAELAISFTDEVMCGRQGNKVGQNKDLARFIKQELSAIKKAKYAL